MLATPKIWVASTMLWVANGAKAPGYKFKAALELDDGRRPATLFVDAYFKHARILGAADKLYFNLMYQNLRIHALHDNAPTRHRNDVGVNEPLYNQLISHPHRHRICDDAVEGYAEPIASDTQEGMWSLFLAESNISNAPHFESPPPLQTVMKI